MIKNINKTVFIVLFILYLPAVVLAQDENSKDDFDFGGETKSSVGGNSSKKENKEEEKSSFSLRGSFALETAVQTQEFRFIRLGPSFHLILDYPNSFASLYAEATGRINSAYYIEKDSKRVKKNYTFEVIGRELYLQKNMGMFTLTLGNKMVVWSQADILPVVDLISVADMTEALFANPEEARLGQNIIELDFFAKRFEANLVFVPYPLFNRMVDQDHPYSYTVGVKVENAPLKRKPEAAIRLRYIGDAFSISALAGYVHNRNPIYEATDSVTTLDSVYKPSPFAAFESSYAFDPFLLKFESRYSFDKAFQKTGCLTADCLPSPLPDGYFKEDEAAMTAGLDYNAGDSVGFFILESSFILPESDFKGSPVIMTAAGWTGSFYRDTIKTALFMIFFESIENLIARAQIEYSISDNFSFITQYTGIVIQKKKEQYGFFDKLDRADLLLRYYF
ncbi:MAG: hypothetical protein OEZ13_09735 [Spirochaetia bacterium]|nr:hypothetical protein [Spirochaetia bacterium]